jgi:protoporphyrin/coproporphyrin ferrochelatase
VPFDAVLIVSFGGPQGPDDIRPFLENVLRGRRVAPGRLEEVAHHYELFGGVSPLTELTLRQADGLRERLAATGLPLPVYVGMRNWHPYLADTLRQMRRDGVRRAIGFIAAAHRSYSSCTQYRENVRAAQAAIAGEAGAVIDITYVPDWHEHPGFIDANAARVVEALDRLPPRLRPGARLVFTAHSIPESMPARATYQRQYAESARLVAERVRALRPDGPTDAVTVYQSRSGRPEDPWLGPDICDYLRASREAGLEAALLSPLGFLVDHVEVLYDLDHEAAAVASEIGLTLERASAVNDHPRFIDAMADTIRMVADTYEHGRPLPLTAAPGSP